MRTMAMALMHAPVLDKSGGEMVSTVTNLDLHDLSRTARTYELSQLFVVTPIEAQRELTARVCQHWTSGSSAQRIPSRQRALALIEPIASLEATLEALGGRERVEIWATAAQARGVPVLSHASARARLEGDDPRTVLLLFGTSWGLAPRIVEQADALLAPLPGRGDFNHLSVRAAAAILCDRLLGARD